jgi:hypothetical protein
VEVLSAKGGEEAVQLQQAAAARFNGFHTFNSGARPPETPGKKGTRVNLPTEATRTRRPWPVPRAHPRKKRARELIV